MCPVCEAEPPARWDRRNRLCPSAVRAQLPAAENLGRQIEIKSKLHSLVVWFVYFKALFMLNAGTEKP